jgi:site-specific recombinase XerD
MNLEEMRENVEAFLADLSIGKPHHTVLAHRVVLNYLMEFGRWEPLEFVRWLGQKELHPNSLNSYIFRFLGFMEWLALEEKIELNVLLERRVRKLIPEYEKALPRQPRESRVEKLFAYVRTPVEALGKTPLQMLVIARDRAILEVMRCTGGRVAEIASLKRKDIDLESQRAIVRGKRRKKRVVFFDDIAWRRVRYYLSLTRDVPEKMPLFLTTRGEIHGLTTESIRKVLDKYCKAAGVGHLFPHQFRHRFGKRMYAGCRDLIATQKAMGHSKTDTTRIYADVDPEEVYEAFRRADL